jgi:uncharacterized delta-60 repeat protein
MKIMKTISLILVTAFSLGAARSAKAENCGLISTVFHPQLVVFENEPFARIWLRRLADTNVVQSIDYFTVDGPPEYVTVQHVARTGVDYVKRSGTATFAVGQSVVSVDVPLIDNGMLDGFKDFSLALTNAAAGLILGEGTFVAGGIILGDCPGCPRWTALAIRIEDNELHATVDPLFVPEAAPWRFDPLVMPDGRILVNGGVQGLTMLQSNGSLDVAFATTVAASFSNAWLIPLRLLSDGRIFATANHAGDPAPRLVRLLPSGALDALFAITNFTALAAVQPDGRILTLSTIASNQTLIRRFNSDGSPDPTAGFTITNFIGIAAEQPDGRLLVLSPNQNFTTALSRRNADGSPDTGFVPSTFVGAWRQFGIRTDGKIFVCGEFSNGRTELRRLNADGSTDKNFSPPATNVFDFLLRRNGKVIVNDGFGNVQLNEDGSIDASFHLDAVPYWNLWRVPQRELPDGSLLALPFLGFQNRVIRWNADGKLDAYFAPDIVGGYSNGCSDQWPLTMVVGDHVFLAGNTVTSVDGFPYLGLTRLLMYPPERDFRVLTPAQFYSSSGVARVQVLRTGPTTNAASVSFTTRDDTAKAGEDYAPQSGTLNFAPLEVSKEVMVPLAARAGGYRRVSFKLELSNPSTGYTNVASTPIVIVIVPELRIAKGSLRPRGDGSIGITLHGTVPGRWYALESSADLKNWEGITGTYAVGSAVVFDNLPPRPLPQFFRARTD